MTLANNDNQNEAPSPMEMDAFQATAARLLPGSGGLASAPAPVPAATGVNSLPHNTNNHRAVGSTPAVCLEPQALAEELAQILKLALIPSLEQQELTRGLQEQAIANQQAQILILQQQVEKQQAVLKQQQEFIERIQMIGVEVANGSGVMTPVSNHQTTLLTISNLPDEALAAVAKFLPKPSRALFAVAMADPSLFLLKSQWEFVSSATANRAILSLHSSTYDSDDNFSCGEERTIGGSSLCESSDYNSDGDDVVFGDEDLEHCFSDDYFFYDDDVEDGEVDRQNLTAAAQVEVDDWVENNDDDDEAEYDYDEDEEEEEEEEEESSDDDSWSTIDFEEIEVSLAAKLSDDDIRGVLICIDGVHRLHTIRLCGCVSITGSGLDPLMGSTMLRTIDLSLVTRTESPEIEPEPALSEASVIPILKSIIDVAGSSLKDVLLPEKFVVGRTVYGDGLHRFVEKYYDVGDPIDLLRRVWSSKN